MIYIIEGIDRAGKTTLANLLSKHLNCKTFHDDFKPVYFYNTDIINNEQKVMLFGEFLSAKFHYLLQALHMQTNDIVVDRFHMTENVYNTVRGQGFYSYNVVDLLLSTMNIKLILVQADNIAESSRQHGSSLLLHSLLFKGLYKNTKIANKCIVRQFDIFNNPDKAIEQVLA